MTLLNSQGRLDALKFANLVACSGPMDKRSQHDDLANILIDLIEKGTISLHFTINN